jgi:hypothetical protein
VIAQLLKSEHFFDVQNIGAAIKSPYDYTLGVLRMLDVPVDDLAAGTLWYYTTAMEQSLFDPPNVKGWPGYRNWMSTTTLPYRNVYLATPLTTQGKIRAIGTDGYGNSYSQINWSDAQVLAWAAKFAGYADDLPGFILALCQYMCAMVPSEALRQSAIQDPLGTPTYEWAGLDDRTRTDKIRKITQAIVTLPEFQLL